MTTMTKKSVLKLAMTIMAAFMFTAVSGQDHPATINHTDDVGDYSVGTTTYQTIGFDFKLYVAPDPVFSPNYQGTGDAGTNLNSGSQWQWVFGPSWDAGVTEEDIAKSWANENWVMITPPEAGTTINYWVKERFGAAGCEDDGTGSSHSVIGVALPTAAIAGRGTDWTELTPDFEFSICGTPINDIIDIVFTETGNDVVEYQKYTYGIRVLRTVYDGNDNVLLDAENNAVEENNDVTATFGKVADPDILTSGLSQEFEIPSPLTIVAHEGRDYVTEYVFSITSESIYSQISQVSQTRADAASTGYDGAVATVTYKIYPQPATGPIYHIPNDAL